MAKMRVHELAKELEIKSQEIIKYRRSFEDTKAFTRHRRFIVRYKRFRKYKSIFETQKNHKSTNEDRRYTRE